MSLPINENTTYSGALTEEVFNKWLATDPLAAIMFPGAAGTMSRAEVYDKDCFLGVIYDMCALGKEKAPSDT